MEAIDYNMLLDHTGYARRERVFSRWSEPVDELYRDKDGVQYATRSGSARYRHEIARLSEGALLLSTDCANTSETFMTQTVRGSDWVHFQFRLDGNAHESGAAIGRLDARAGSCVVGRYPDGTLIDRGIAIAKRSRYACLFMKPEAVSAFLDARANDLPSAATWIAEQGPRELQISVLPLQSAMSLAVNDILACSFRGAARRAYLRAKTIELLSIVIHGLNDEDAKPLRSHKRLSTSDLLKISAAKALISKGVEPQMTLGELAHCVGLNRSKLAYGFKQVYGVSVRQYWRDTRLDEAYRLLQEGGRSITELALTMGYLDPSSFTRAFTQKFGILPRRCKR